jgi:hypothetical protein
MSNLPAWRDELAAWQSRINLTANHRYQVLNATTGKWEYVPGVTGSLSKDKGAVENLKKWAAECVEKEALRRLEFWRKAGATGDPNDVLAGVWEAYKRVSDDATSKGTTMHAHFERECRLRMGENPPDIPITHEEQVVLDKFRRFADRVQLRPVAVEARVYCQPVFGAEYAGTLDLWALSIYSPEFPEVWDYKGKDKIQTVHYADEALQSAAYRKALVNMLRLPFSPGGRIVNYPRPGNDFDLIDIPVLTPLEPTWTAFCAGLVIQNWRREVFDKTQRATKAKRAA